MINVIKKFAPDIWDIIKKQGISFLLLCAAIVYFQSEVIRLRSMYENCNEHVIALLKEEKNNYL